MIEIIDDRWMDSELIQICDGGVVRCLLSIRPVDWGGWCDNSSRSPDPFSRRRLAIAARSLCWSGRTGCTPCPSARLIAPAFHPFQVQTHVSESRKTWTIDNWSHLISSHLISSHLISSITISALAWYCMVTMATKVWLHWTLKTPSGSWGFSSAELPNSESLDRDWNPPEVWQYKLPSDCNPIKNQI